MPSRKELEKGEVFGMLTVTGSAEATFSKSGARIYCVNAKCDCGKKILVRETSLRAGNTRSCGCLQRAHAKSGAANLRHGLSASPTYKTWQSIMTRCHNDKATGYEFWGGRGISVCEKWRSFDGFLSDMGERPRGYTLDRIDNDGNYEPGNCRWADKRTQSQNTSQVKLVTIDGEVMSTNEAMRRLSRSQSTALDLMRRKGVTRQQAVDHYAKK